MKTFLFRALCLLLFSLTFAVPAFAADSASFAPITATGGDLDMGGKNMLNANQIAANNVQLAAGNSLRVGDGVFYGDSLNTAARQQGGFYVQDLSGNMGHLLAGQITLGGVTKSSWPSASVGYSSCYYTSCGWVGAQTRTCNNGYYVKGYKGCGTTNHNDSARLLCCK